MEREHLQKLDASWGHEPTSNPSGGGESMSGTLAEFPSWEGSGGGSVHRRHGGGEGANPYSRGGRAPRYNVAGTKLEKNIEHPTPNARRGIPGARVCDPQHT